MILPSSSSSGDSTARIWTIADGTSKGGAQNGPLNVLVLKHVKGRTNEKSKDVTTLDWNVSSLSLFLRFLTTVVYFALVIVNIHFLCTNNLLSRYLLREIGLIVDSSIVQEITCLLTFFPFGLRHN